MRTNGEHDAPRASGSDTVMVPRSPPSPGSLLSALVALRNADLNRQQRAYAALGSGLATGEQGIADGVRQRARRDAWRQQQFRAQNSQRERDRFILKAQREDEAKRAETASRDARLRSFDEHIRNAPERAAAAARERNGLDLRQQEIDRRVAKDEADKKARSDANNIRIRSMMDKVALADAANKRLSSAADDRGRLDAAKAVLRGIEGLRELRERYVGEFNGSFMPENKAQIASQIRNIDAEINRRRASMMEAERALDARARPAPIETGSAAPNGVSEPAGVTGQQPDMMGSTAGPPTKATRPGPRLETYTFLNHGNKRAFKIKSPMSRESTKFVLDSIVDEVEQNNRDPQEVVTELIELLATENLIPDLNVYTEKQRRGMLSRWIDESVVAHYQRVRGAGDE